MTFQPKNFQAETTMIDDCEGAHPLFETDGRAIVFLLPLCGGGYTVNLQGTNGSGWQSLPIATRREANHQADLAAREAGAMRVRG
jgi:hypothetical protein